jgi:hypothetical protein
VQTAGCSLLLPHTGRERPAAQVEELPLRSLVGSSEATTDHTSWLRPGGSVQTVSVNTSRPSHPGQAIRQGKGVSIEHSSRCTICRRDDNAFPHGNLTAEEGYPVALPT